VKSTSYIFMKFSKRQAAILRASDVVTFGECQFCPCGGDNDRRQELRHFGSRNMPFAISHYSFCFKVMDDWQTKNNSVECIPHIPSLIRVVETL